MVSVTRKAEYHRDLRSSAKIIDSKNAIQKTTAGEIRNRRNGFSLRRGGEPGIASNAGLSLPNCRARCAGGSCQHSREERTVTSRISCRRSIGSAKPRRAMSPWSARLFAFPPAISRGSCSIRTAATKEPTDKDLAPLIEAELAQNPQRCASLHGPAVRKGSWRSKRTSTLLAVVATVTAQVSPLSLDGDIGRSRPVRSCSGHWRS